jgi:hypothetical protein
VNGIVVGLLDLIGRALLLGVTGYLSLLLLLAGFSKA